MQQHGQLSASAMAVVCAQLLSLAQARVRQLELEDRKIFQRLGRVVIRSSEHAPQKKLHLLKACCSDTTRNTAGLAHMKCKFIGYYQSLAQHAKKWP